MNHMRSEYCFQFLPQTVSSNMILLKLLYCIPICIGVIEAKAFFFSAPKFLSSFISSSAGPSSFETNIADLRYRKQARLENSPNDDNPKPSFAKSQNDNDEANQEEANNEAIPDFFQKKLEKVLQKIQLLSTLTNFGDQSDDDSSANIDDFDKEKAAFDRDFNDGHDKDNVVEQVGYDYQKPAKSAKQKLSDDNDDEARASSGGLGVYIMELVGSFIGLAIGAYASLASGSSTTTSSPISFS